MSKAIKTSALSKTNKSIEIIGIISKALEGSGIKLVALGNDLVGFEVDYDDGTKGVVDVKVTNKKVGFNLSEAGEDWKHTRGEQQKRLDKATKAKDEARKAKEKKLLEATKEAKKAGVDTASIISKMEAKATVRPAPATPAPAMP